MSDQETRGAELTFEEFVTATAGRLLRTAVFLVNDRHLAEDLLRYWCDLSEQEIAETLGISRGTVKSHSARAMAALRDRMEGRADER